MTIDTNELKRPFREFWQTCKGAPGEIADLLGGVVEVLEIVLPISALSRFLGRH